MLPKLFTKTLKLTLQSVIFHNKVINYNYDGNYGTPYNFSLIK